MKRRLDHPLHLVPVISAWALGAALAGCGGGPEVLVEEPLKPRPVPEGVVLFPVAALTPGANALECIARTGDAARWLLEHTELPILGPADYASFKEPEDMRVASIDTDLMSRTSGARTDLQNWLSVHIMITENRATNVRDIEDRRQKDPKKLKIYRQYGIDAEVTVEVTVADGRYGKPLARAVVRGIDNPADVRSDGDPRPMLPQLIGLALERAFLESESVVAARPRRKVRGPGLLDAVPLLAAWKTPQKPSFIQALEGKEEIEREGALESLWTRFQPNLPVEATFVGKKHPGVMALQDRPPLARYDVVTEVAGQPVQTVYQLDRLLQACAAKCPARVRRGFTDVDVNLAWPLATHPDEQ